jgi:flagellin
MASIINTNINSLTAQRNLSSTQSSLTTSMQRLSSGLRINSAKDDSAGMAIADRMTSQVRGLNQAARNANDAISLAQTAEGALGSIADNLQRMRELAVQAANGTLTDDNRAKIQAEVSQLKAEIDRVGNQTQFNGIQLLDGSNGGLSFQVGSDANQSIAITTLTDARTAALGTSTYAEMDGDNVTLPTTAANGELSLSTLEGSTTGTSVKVGGFKIAGVEITGTDLSVADNTKVTLDEYKQYMQKNVDAINAKSSETGVSASLVVSDDGTTAKISLVGAKTSGNPTGAIKYLDNSSGIGAKIGLVDADIDGTDGKGAASEHTGIGDIDVGTASGANKAMIMLDGAISSVDAMRGDLGAIQNRFSSTIANLQSSAENLTASRSRIQDADFASETANLSRAQILQQAGTAMVAQANQLPQGVLALLR